MEYVYIHTPKAQIDSYSILFHCASFKRSNQSVTFVLSQESEERWLSFLFTSTRDLGGSLQLHSTAQRSLEDLEPNSVLSSVF